MSAVMKDSGVEWIGEIPEGWGIDRFKDIANLRNEKIKIQSNEKNYLELENIEQGTGKLLSIGSTKNVESAVTKFYKNDVLFSKLRPYLEKYYLSKFDGLCTGEILAFEPKRVEPDFLYYNVSSHWFINIVNSLSYGTKMPRVNWATQIALLDIPLPPKEEQKMISDFLDKETQKIDTLKANVEKQIKKLTAYKKSLIYEYVTGKKQL